MSLILEALTKDDCEMLRRWRNIDIHAYRTPFLLTAEMQENFYLEVICDRTSPHRYWAVRTPLDMALVAVVGLTNISWENRHAEISIVVDPNKRKMGYGEKSLKLLLAEGFYQLGLNMIYGECYKCSESYKWWDDIIEKYQLYSTLLPDRKYHWGQFWGAIYFVFKRDTLIDYS